MPFIIADRVRESSTTVGTGSIALGGAVTGYQTFDAVLDTTDTTFYTIADQGGANWEVGIGTFTAPSTLARTTILSSSNGGSIVNFGAGTKDVFISLPASRTNVNDQPNVISVNSASDALRITQVGSGNALLVEDSANPDSSPFVVTADGSVGVGLTIPTFKLQVYSSGATTFVGARVQNDAVATDQSVGNGFSRVWNSTNHPMIFGTNDAERMRIDNVGNVGIGTAVPVGKLDILTGTNRGYFDDAGGTLFRLNGVIANNTAYAPISINGSITTLQTGAIERMRIDPSGNALINTTTAVSRLTVNGDVSGTFFVNPTTVSANYTIPTNYNAMTTGPISVNSGVVVTVPSGSTWTVI